MSDLCPLCRFGCCQTSSQSCPGDAAVLNGSWTCDLDPGSDWGDCVPCHCQHCQKVACDQGSVAGTIPVTRGVCPGCERDFGEPPRIFSEAALPLRAKTGRCPSAFVGCPDTPPALKKEAWKDWENQSFQEINVVFPHSQKSKWYNN